MLRRTGAKIRLLQLKLELKILMCPANSDRIKSGTEEGRKSEVPKKEV